MSKILTYIRVDQEKSIQAQLIYFKYGYKWSVEHTGKPEHINIPCLVSINDGDDLMLLHLDEDEVGIQADIEMEIDDDNIVYDINTLEELEEVLKLTTVKEFKIQLP